MPANIEKMAYVSIEGGTWHGLGEALDRYPTSAEMLRASGLDWGVERSPMLDDTLRPFPGRYILRRDSDGAPLGTVGDGYQADAPRDLFAFGDGVVQDGQATWSTAGSILRGGLPNVWASMRIEDDWRIADEEYKPYLFIATDYDGKLSFTAKPTAIRVVCANTFALAEKASGGVTIRHNAKNRDAQFAEARRLLSITTKEMRRFKTWAEGQQQWVATSDLTTKVEELIAPKPVSDDVEVRRKAETMRDNVLTRFNGEFLAPEVARNGRTRYSLWNAVTGYADHGARLRKTEGNNESQARLMSTMFGTGANLKSKAYALLTTY